MIANVASDRLYPAFPQAVQDVTGIGRFMDMSMITFAVVSPLQLLLRLLSNLRPSLFCRFDNRC